MALERGVLCALLLLASVIPAQPAAAQMPPPCASSSSSATWLDACSAQQYQLTNSDGLTWLAMDPSLLSITFGGAANAFALITANASLWTSSPGDNQDLGIAVTGGIYPNRGGVPEVWKESGGPTAYAPNVASAQAMIPLQAATTYTAKIVWKANQPDPGSIFAGAGPIGGDFSPTRLTVWILPSGTMDACSRCPEGMLQMPQGQQYSLNGSDGRTWQDFGNANPANPTAPQAVSVTPPTGSWLALVSGSSDLWTSSAGVNQDFGITASGPGYPTTPGQPETWKESGGSAAFSPTAAMVQGALPVTGGNTYTFKLQWKASRPDSGTIWAGSGPDNHFYSLTTLDLVLIPVAPAPASAAQHTLANSDGTTWSTIDANALSITFTPAATTNAVFWGNVDLWANTAGFGQDVGIMVSGGAFGAGTLLAWEESGSSGAFSPNAAFVITDASLSGGTQYTAWLVWKTNHSAGGVTIFAGAGPVNTRFSPTWIGVMAVA